MLTIPIQGLTSFTPKTLLSITWRLQLRLWRPSSRKTALREFYLIAFAAYAFYEDLADLPSAHRVRLYAPVGYL